MMAANIIRELRPRALLMPAVFEESGGEKAAWFGFVRVFMDSHFWGELDPRLKDGMCL